MRLVKLTRRNSGEPIYVNPDFVTCVQRGMDKSETDIFVVERMGVVTINQPIDEVLEALTGEQRE